MITFSFFLLSCFVLQYFKMLCGVLLFKSRNMT